MANEIKFSSSAKNRLEMENEVRENKKELEVPAVNGNSSSKRTNYLDWDEYFMALVFLSAQRSKDPCTQVGACIVDEQNRIVSVGYNGMPRGCNDDEFPWGKENKDSLDNKHLYVCHAEVNAILNKNLNDLRKCVMYVGLFPCNECAKIIIQSGIRSIIYMSDKHSEKLKTKAAKRLFDAACVEYRQYIPKKQQITIDFTAIEWNAQVQSPQTPLKSQHD